VRILISNDDGIYSPGIRALARIASRFGEVRIVAPDVERSSMGHAITHSRPLRVRRTPIEDFEAYRVDGTPADCVYLALLNLLPRKPALVAHPGEEMCFVLEGNVEFQVGDDTIALERGDSIHLRSDVPHMAWARGAGNARLLMVTSIENQSAIAVEWWSHIACRKSERESTAKGRAK